MSGSSPPSCPPTSSLTTSSSSGGRPRTSPQRAGSSNRDGHPRPVRGNSTAAEGGASPHDRDRVISQFLERKRNESIESGPPPLHLRDGSRCLPVGTAADNGLRLPRWRLHP